MAVNKELPRGPDGKVLKGNRYDNAFVNCLECGDIFEPAGGHNIFCSRPCGQKHNRVKAKADKKAKHAWLHKYDKALTVSNLPNVRSTWEKSRGFREQMEINQGTHYPPTFEDDDED